jgi:3-deoxy-D-manno-octulosonate 8-phosphate phosphatase (KDO 8-P phosphatase)
MRQVSTFCSDPDVSVTVLGLRRAESLLRAGGACHVVIDVDGCFTPGYQVVTLDGSKPVKVFGLDDYAALMRWRDFVTITAITSDYCLPTRSRFEKWGIALKSVPAAADDRVNTIERITDNRLSGTVYMGDGYHDAAVMARCGFGIAPSDAWPETLRAADVVTKAPGGRRAVALALDFIGENLLESPGQA